jgi:hypothetical protein
MNDELGRIWKEAVRALSLIEMHFSGRIAETLETVVGIDSVLA